MKHRVFLLILSLFAIPLAFAQELKVGADVTTPNGPDVAPASVRTDISLDPATASGQLTSATVYWSKADCAYAFIIKVFRRSGDVLIPIAARGPFSTTSNVMTIDIKPEVSIAQGDLIGVVRLGDCGTPGTLSGTSSAGYLSYSGNVATSTAVLDGQRVNAALAVSGSGFAVEGVVAVLPVVGSVKGVFGSTFKTSLQLLNPTSHLMTGWLLFHSHGIVASFDNAKGYSYLIPPGQQISVDLDEAFTGSRQHPIGLGTLDVDLQSGAGRPQIVARVYNDAGAGGTAGFYEDPILLGDDGVGGHVIRRGATGFMVTPVDPARTRFNIGVRTFFSGADLRADLLDNLGHVLASTSRHYPANYFEQVDGASFFNGVPISASKIVRIIVDDGSAIVYGATTDNVTNDPSVQYAVVAPASN